jgi:hypothetical protein
MASTAQNLRREQKLTDWLRPHLTWITGPSWLLSAGAHVGTVVLLVILSQSPSCRSDIQGDGGESFREVGIRLREASPAAMADAADEPVNDADAVLPADELISQPQREDVPAQPPVELSLPAAVGPAVIGTGLPSVSAPGVSSILEPSMTGGPRTQPPNGGGEQGATSLFGAKDVGSKFVYVIDRSWSMEGDAIHVVPLSMAKSELTASIQRLEATQQFQIIFYNEEPFVLVNDNGRFDYFFGTDTQRLDAVRQLRSVQPSGGTDHMPALEEALDLAPDVVFFLTDGEEPALSDRNIQRLAQRGRGARIHCIQFGKEPESAKERDPGNWLRKLAAATDGTYVYRDVTRLGRQ